MTNIALGQYYPSDSIIHKLDPRMKIVLGLLFVIISFLCRNTASFLFLLLSALTLIIVSKIPVRIVLRSIKALIFIMCFTAAINIFWTSGPQENLLWSWRFLKVYKDGLFNAAFMLIRIVSMVIGSSILLTYTTTPIELTDGIEQLLSPLNKLHIHVHEFAMLMSIALRFIPTILEEAEKIIAAQKSRGSDFTTGSLIKRVKTLVPLLIPLLISAFRHATDLATAMTCRCYRGGEGRTRLNVLRYSAKDFVFLFAIIMIGIGVVILNITVKIPFWGFSM